MKRLLSTAFAVVLLLGLAALAVLARPNEAVQTTSARADSGVTVNAPPSPLGKLPASAKAGGPKYNTIALAIDNGKAFASELVNDINATTGSTALQALKWDATTGFAIYDPNDLFSVDFPLAVGDPVFLLMQGASATVYSLVGNVPAAGSVHFNLTGATPACKYNFISVPLDKGPINGIGGITLASELATNIGDVSQVLAWDPNTGFAIYDPNDLFSVDFSVQIGYPYYVCMTASKTWPAP
ncbi:MAG: hypothetical protein NT169_23515 [Chloroflexi bacterium]|nr:hypothetical protein [Chloroflexota bacterium]